MRNRVLMLAAAAASLAGMGPHLTGPAQANQVNIVQQGGGTQAPQGGISSMLDAILRYRMAGGAGFRKPTYRKRDGYSCAEGARRKTRQRNKLRSKGQFRKAVR